MDLEKMNREELLALKANVEKALKTLEARRKSEARKALEKTAREFGFTIEELTGAAPKSAAVNKGVPRYANPENPDQTWTGRGRKPNWVIAWIESGKDLEALAI